MEITGNLYKKVELQGILWNPVNLVDHLCKAAKNIKKGHQQFDKI